MFRQTTAMRRTTVVCGKSRGANCMARHSSDVLDAIYMPDCVSGRQTPIAGENTASATMGVASRRTGSMFSTNDRLLVERISYRATACCDMSGHATDGGLSRK